MTRCPLAGSTWTILMVSLRCPPASGGIAELLGLGRGLPGPAVRADQQHVVGLAVGRGHTGRAGARGDLAPLVAEVAVARRPPTTSSSTTSDDDHPQDPLGGRRRRFAWPCAAPAGWGPPPGRRGWARGTRVPRTASARPGERSRADVRSVAAEERPDGAGSAAVVGGRRVARWCGSWRVAIAGATGRPGSRRPVEPAQFPTDRRLSWCHRRWSPRPWSGSRPAPRSRGTRRAPGPGRWTVATGGPANEVASRMTRSLASRVAS